MQAYKINYDQVYACDNFAQAKELTTKFHEPCVKENKELIDKGLKPKWFIPDWYPLLVSPETKVYSYDRLAETDVAYCLKHAKSGTVICVLEENYEKGGKDYLVLPT